MVPAKPPNKLEVWSQIKVRQSILTFAPKSLDEIYDSQVEQHNGD